MYWDLGSGGRAAGGTWGTQAMACRAGEGAMLLWMPNLADKLPAASGLGERCSPLSWVLLRLPAAHAARAGGWSAREMLSPGATPLQLPRRGPRLGWPWME